MPHPSHWGPTQGNSSSGSLTGQSFLSCAFVRTAQSAAKKTNSCSGSTAALNLDIFFCSSRSSSLVLSDISVNYMQVVFSHKVLYLQVWAGLESPGHMNPGGITSCIRTDQIAYRELTSIPRYRISQWIQQDNTWLRNIYRLSRIPPVTMPILSFRGEKWDIHYTAHISPPPQCYISYCQRARTSTSLQYGPPHIVLFNHLPPQTTSHTSLLLLHFLPPSC